MDVNFFRNSYGKGGAHFDLTYGLNFVPAVGDTIELEELDSDEEFTILCRHFTITRHGHVTALVEVE